MKRNNKRLQTDDTAAQKRVEDIAALFESIKDVLVVAVAEFGKPSATAPKAVISKLMELQSAHLAVLKAEEAFYDKIQSNGNADDIDFDAIRSDIGGQIDRIRATIDAAKIP